jgi:hypothetical protein
MHLLLKSGARVGSDAFEQALGRHQSDMIMRLLLDYGIRDTEDRVLFQAAQRGEWGGVQLLLASGLGEGQ